MENVSPPKIEILDAISKIKKSHAERRRSMFPLYLSPFDWAQDYDLVEGDFMIRTTILEMASSNSDAILFCAQHSRLFLYVSQ